MKGSPKETPNPSIPILNCIAPDSEPESEPTSNEPNMGPVQENETNAKVRDMKNIPIMPPFEDFESDLFIIEFGKVISK